MKKYIKNPYAERTANIRENGCTIRITRGDGADKEIVEERTVTPREIQLSNERRDVNMRSKVSEMSKIS